MQVTDGLRLAREENRITGMWELDEIRDQLAGEPPFSRILYRAAERNLQEACIGLAKQALKSASKEAPSDARKAF